MKKIVIVGNGGFAREIEWMLDRINRREKQWDFLGFIDKDTGPNNVLGDDNFLLHMQEEIYAAIAIGNPQIRMKLYEKYKNNENIRFPNLVDPSVEIGDSIKLGEGNIICAMSVFTVNIHVGNFNIVNLGCTVGHDVTIGNFNTINPGANISGGVKINNLADIGTGVKVIQGMNIGKGAVLAAGAVIIQDVPENSMVAGVPGRIKKTYEPFTP